MRGAEFIGIYHPYSNANIVDAVRGIILYQLEEDLETKNNLLLVFYLGGSIWKRSGRHDILEKVYLNGDVIVQRYQRIRFKVIKILKKDLSVEKLENHVKQYKEYIMWKNESERCN